MDYNLALHVDSDDSAIMKLALNNAANYFAALQAGAFSVVIVVNGPAVVLLSGAKSELAAKAIELAERGLEIRVCSNALRANNILPEDIWPICKVVPAGIVELVHLQRAGYAYIKP